MPYTINRNNDTNGTGTSEGDGVASGTGAGTQQPAPGRNQATAKVNWTKELGKLATKCYMKSEPNRTEYRKIMYHVWNVIGVCEMSEQKLADK